MTDPASRPLRLLMMGPGTRRITPDLGDQLARLFDLSPQTRLIEVETDQGGVSVSPDWPSDHLEKVAAIEAEIDGIPGISRITMFQLA